MKHFKPGDKVTVAGKPYTFIQYFDLSGHAFCQLLAEGDGQVFVMLPELIITPENS